MRRIYIVGGGLESWFGVAGALQQGGLEIRPLSADTDLAELARRAEGEGAVVLVDLGGDPGPGLVRLRAVRAAAPTLGVGVAVTAESPELSRELSAAGVGCVLVHPLEAEPAKAALLDLLRSRDEARAAARKRVLIIDDDVDFCNVVTSLLAGQGMEVLRAANGKAGLVLAVKEKPDLIILDIMMENDWSGYEVNQTLKQQSGYERVRHTPILMVSSISQPPDARFAGSEEAAGFSPDSYLSKPLDIPVFLETVRKLLGPEEP